MVVDVGNDWVGYIRLFGVFQFSVRLGPCSGLPQKSLALNPGKRGRFELTVTAPSIYRRRARLVSAAEHEITLVALRKSVGLVQAAWDQQAAEEHAHNEAKELAEMLAFATDDAGGQANIIAEWHRRRKHLDGGGRWGNALDFSVAEGSVDHPRACSRCNVDMRQLANRTWFCPKCGYQGWPLPPLHERAASG